MIKKFEKTLLDRLRVALILLVVIGHATRMFSPMGVFSERIPVDPILSLITKVIYSFHMPLFVMISGYVYGICVQKSKDYMSFYPVVRKKILRLLVPYLFWGISFVAPIMIALSITKLSYLEFVRSGILLSLDSRQLWYLAALFLIFLLVHGGRLVLGYLKVYNKIPLAVKCLVFIIVAFLLRYLPLPACFQISNAIYYLPYFIGGYFIKRADLNSVLDRILLLVGVIIICYSLGLIGSISIVVFCSLLCLLKIERLPFFNVVKTFGMGIYILHPMMLYVIYYYYPSMTNSYYTILYTIGSVLIVMWVSILVCKLIKRFKLSFLLGE